MMSEQTSIQAHLGKHGISRRAFLKFCSSMASALALSPADAASFGEQVAQSLRPSIIWLSFQECTGCTESLTRSHAPKLEDLIFDFISLDYHHTLQAASGFGAEAAREDAIKQHYGNYLLVVDGSVPLALDGACSTIAGRTNLDILQECVEGAAAVIAIGTCATFGGLPAARPNPTQAVGVGSLMQQGLVEERKLINIPGCPPLPVVISSVLAHFLAFNRFPKLDIAGRPVAFYGNTIHERCSRYHFYQQELFAERFDDEGARKGWCLYKLGCRGPTTHNSCTVYKWNNGTSNPIESGHGCIGCSEPGFWDNDPFYISLDQKLLASTSTADTQVGVSPMQGREIYESNCVYCHRSDPSALRTPPDAVADVIRSGSVGAHRRLDFSENQLQALESYLKSLKD
jgi:hydrogenase small subunit